MVNIEVAMMYELYEEKLDPMYLPCGGTAYFDDSSGISYRCDHCMAVVGSIGQPQSCKDEEQKYLNWKKLGGKGWDYNLGCVK